MAGGTYEEQGISVRLCRRTGFIGYVMVHTRSRSKLRDLRAFAVHRLRHRYARDGEGCADHSELASVSGDHEEYFLQEESKVITEIIGKFGFK